MSLINIPIKVIENTIGLLFTKDYNSAFFAKELVLPIALIDFTNILSKIKKSQIIIERNKIINQVIKHPSCPGALKKFKINPIDFKYIL